MKKVQNVIRSLGGSLSPEGFSILCLAVHYAILWQPLIPQMKVIQSDISVKTHKSAATATKALERAVYALWSTCDRSRLATFQRSWAYEPPKPKEFIAVVAQILWDGVEREQIAD